MRLFVALVAVLGALLGQFSAVEVVAESKIVLSRHFPSAAPCSGLFTMSEFEGCSSKRDNKKNVGTIRFFDSIDDVLEVISQKSFKGSFAISYKTWCVMTKDILEQLNSLASSLVVVQTDSSRIADCLPPSGYDPKWNKFGSGTIQANLHYPVSHLSLDDSEDFLEYVADPGKQELRFEFYMGRTDGSVNTAVCLNLGRCLPLGGLSSWATVHSPPYDVGQDAILLTTNLDGTAFFKDLSYGFHASGGDIIVLLSTLEILARLPATSTRVIGAFFQGETFDRIGSRRFVQDVLHGQCDVFSSRDNETCSNPPSFSLEFTKFNKSLAPFKSIISLSNVLRADLALNETNVFRTDKINGLTLAIADRFVIELQDLAEAPPGNFVQPIDNLPPSPLSSFTERSEWQNLADTGGFVLTGYKSDISEANPHYQTEDDVMDMAKLDKYVEQVDILSSALARSIYFAASNGTETTERANSGLIRDLLLCFGGDFASNCTLALQSFNITQTDLKTYVQNSAFVADLPFSYATTKPLASYTGVYHPLAPLAGGAKLREVFVRNLLANITLGGKIPSPGQQAPFQQCSSDVTCRDAWDGIAKCPGKLASNASVACVGGRCVCTTAFYHEAWSIGLRLNSRLQIVLNPNNTLDKSIYTEPYWEPAKFVAFTAGSSRDAAAALVVGILLIGATVLGLELAKRRSDRLGKFKLA